MYMSLVIAKIAYNCTNLKMFLAKIYTNLKITAAPSLHCRYFTATPSLPLLHCHSFTATPPLPLLHCHSSGVNRKNFTLRLCKPAPLPYFCRC